MVRFPFTRSLKTWRVEKTGSVAVEFALAAIPFFMLVIGLLEVSLMFAAATVLEGGTVAASRLVRTGQAQASADPMQTFEDALCDHVGALIPCASLRYEAIVPDDNTFTDAEGMPPTFDGDGNLVSDGFDPGGVSDVVVVRVAYRYNFLTPMMGPILGAGGDGNSVLLMSTVTVRNEPYEFED